LLLQLVCMLACTYMPDEEIDLSNSIVAGISLPWTDCPSTHGLCKGQTHHAFATPRVGKEAFDWTEYSPSIINLLCFGSPDGATQHEHRAHLELRKREIWRLRDEEIINARASRINSKATEFQTLSPSLASCLVTVSVLYPCADFPILQGHQQIWWTGPGPGGHSEGARILYQALFFFSAPVCGVSP
jgi:hypothetical protein